jgi:hypothetical protein
MHLLLIIMMRLLTKGVGLDVMPDNKIRNWKWIAETLA